MPDDELEKAHVKLHSESGHSGLIQYDGVVFEEDLRSLSNPTIRRRVYKEMSKNEPIIGAMLFAIDKLIRGVEFSMQPGSDDPRDIETSDFVWSCFDDMSTSWEDTLSEILTFLPEGFAYHELVYKMRNGHIPDRPGESSKHSDGKIGWRKMPGRSQDSLDRWIFDDEGGVQAFVQQVDTGEQATIPIQKALLFRTSTVKGSPEGESVLRTAYRAWFYKKRVTSYEAIGIERDLVGLPVLTVPQEWTDSNAPSGIASAYAAAKDMVRNIRRDEQEGVVIPAIYDEHGNKTLELNLLSSGGKRNFDIDKVVARYNHEMAVTLLADFILLGSKEVGSFALADSKTSIFSAAIGAFLDMVVGVINRHAIPRLLVLNGLPTENAPQLQHGDIETADLGVLGEFASKLSQMGIRFDNDQKNYLLDQAGIPLLPDDLEEDEEELDIQEDVPVEEEDPTAQIAEAAEVLAEKMRKLES